MVGNGVTLVEVDKDDVDGASAPILGGVVPLCTLKEWSPHSWQDMMDYAFSMVIVFDIVEFLWWCCVEGRGDSSSWDSNFIWDVWGHWRGFCDGK